MTADLGGVYLFSQKNPLQRDIELMGMSEMSCLYAPHPVIGLRVEESIARDGLLNPLVVVPRDVLGHKLAYYIENHHVDNPDAPYFVYTGNNRYAAALNLGYRHVEVYVCHDLSLLPEWEAAMAMNPREYAA